MKVPRGFESHPLRQRVSEADKIALRVVKSPRARRFLSSKSRRERSIGEEMGRFSEILSVSTFRSGLWRWPGWAPAHLRQAPVRRIRRRAEPHRQGTL